MLPGLASTCLRLEIAGGAALIQMRSRLLLEWLTVAKYEIIVGEVLGKSVICMRSL